MWLLRKDKDNNRNLIEELPLLNGIDGPNNNTKLVQ